MTVVVAIVALEVLGCLILALAIWTLMAQRRRRRRSAQGRAGVMVMDEQQEEDDPGQTQVILALTPAETNAAAVYVASLAPGSRRTMRGALDDIATMLAGVPADAFSFPWHLVRFEHTQLVRAHLAERFEFTTANKMLSALRGTLKASWQLGQIPAEQYQAAVAVKGVTGATLPAGRALEGDELTRLVAICQSDAPAAGERDAAILVILYQCGLRRAELAGLDLDDYDRRQGALRILGKRNKRRVTFLDEAEGLLHGWLRARGEEDGPLFCHVSLEGQVLVEARLSESGIYKMLQRRAHQAGVEDVSPHDFRRTFVSDLLDRGVDIVTVRDMAGHSSVETTARYDRRGDATKKKAASLLRLPVKEK